MKKTFAIVFTSLLLACSSDIESQKKFEAYSGPIMEADTVQIIYSDSAVVRVIVKATKQYEYENGDREFPNDIFIEFYGTDGKMSSTLEANSAYYTAEVDLYKAEGDVEVIGYEDNRKLNSEELLWDPKKEEIYTDKFVRVQSGDQISTGTGLVAKQDFSSYRILKPSGTIYLEEDSTAREDTPPAKEIEKPQESEGKPKKKIIKKNVQ